VDWEAFQFGGRITGPFNARKLREWQLFRETTNGIAGLWMCHLIDLAPWYLEQPYPKHAMTMGGVYLWKDGRETADVFQSTVEYNECLVNFSMSLTNPSGNRNVWYGTKGTLDIDNLTITRDGTVAPLEKPPVESHMANFLRCVRSRQTPRASVDNGFQHAVAGCIAGVALETGRRVSFDREKLEIV
jgi:predicted dehydrogenase